MTEKRIIRLIGLRKSKNKTIVILFHFSRLLYLFHLSIIFNSREQKKKHVSSSSTINMDIIAETDAESNNSDNPLQQLQSLLAHIRIGGPQLTAAEFVEMDTCIPTFNEWDDYEHLNTSIQVAQGDNEEEDAFVEKPPNLSEVLEIMRRLHLFASIEQPQLHNLIYDLESQLTDIYLDSKAVKQSSITDYFS